MPFVAAKILNTYELLFGDRIPTILEGELYP